MKELRKLAELANTTDAERADMEHAQFKIAHLAKQEFEATVTPTVVLQLLDRLEKAEGDAARYQWLLEKAYVGIAPHPKPHEVWCLRLPNPKGCENLDAAIDKAMEVK